MVILKKIVRYISAFDYYEGIYWFGANTLKNKNVTVFWINVRVACWIFPIVTSYITSSTSFARIMLEKP